MRKNHNRRLQLQTSGIAVLLAVSLALFPACSEQRDEIGSDQESSDFDESYGGRSNDPDAHFSERQSREQKEEQQEVEEEQGLQQPEHNLELQEDLQRKPDPDSNQEDPNSEG